MVVGFTTSYAIGVYHHRFCEFESRSGRDVQHHVIGPSYWYSFYTSMWPNIRRNIALNLYTKCIKKDNHLLFCELWLTTITAL